MRTPSEEVTLFRKAVSDTYQSCYSKVDADLYASSICVSLVASASPTCEPLTEGTPVVMELSVWSKYPVVAADLSSLLGTFLIHTTMLHAEGGGDRASTSPEKARYCFPCSAWQGAGRARECKAAIASLHGGSGSMAISLRYERAGLLSDPSEIGLVPRAADGTSWSHFVDTWTQRNIILPCLISGCLVLAVFLGFLIYAAVLMRVIKAEERRLRLSRKRR